jgi:vancomycin resistance protein YoaR
VGGGISQLTTTVFNAAFFGGYPIPEWQAHSYYISRYPLGREATLSWPSPDLKFVNDTDTALLIKTGYTDVSITVKIFGTKTREVVALDPVVTARTATGYWTQVIRVIKENGVEVGRDEFKTFYKNGSPLTQEEVEAAEEAERQKEKEKAKEEQGGNQGSGDEQPPAEETPPPPDDSGN